MNSSSGCRFLRNRVDGRKPLRANDKLMMAKLRLLIKGNEIIASFNLSQSDQTCHHSNSGKWSDYVPFEQILLRSNIAASITTYMHFWNFGMHLVHSLILTECSNAFVILN
jgi:hypothetical protein